jgi:15,16-dihydrobiliverdin:ferredoxin oxidoreductase
MCVFVDFVSSYHVLLSVSIFFVLPHSTYGIVQAKPLRSISTKSISPVAPIATPTPNSASKRLPWAASVDPSKKLSYMPMFLEQLELIKSMGMTQVPVEDEFVCQTSTAKPARIGSLQFQNEHFRKVRMTYFDAGDNVQVFNTLWYPSYEYDLPLLGVDLISLGKSRVLSVIDMQPLHPSNEYSDKYISQLSPIKAKYPDLHGILSGKIYDDTSFFSKNMLFGRFTDESKLDNVVLPSFKDYLQKYVSMMDNAVPDTSEEAMAVVKSRQQQYDTYSAQKDPAVGLFDSYFGKTWSESYVHDFLFEMSPRPSHD